MFLAEKSWGSQEGGSSDRYVPFYIVFFLYMFSFGIQSALVISKSKGISDNLYFKVVIYILIGRNARLVNDIITSTNEQNIPCALLFLDFENSIFDSVECNFALKVLEKF